MVRSTRRRLLRLGGAASVAGLAGCTSVLGDRPSSDTDLTEPLEDAPSCDEYAYRPSRGEPAGELPWDLQIRNVALSVYPVTVAIEDRSGGTPETVASCTATAEGHAELSFDLSGGTEYRVRATLHRPTPETASTTFTGALDANEAIELTVEDGAFVGRRVHYDPGRPA